MSPAREAMKVGLEWCAAALLAVLVAPLLVVLGAAVAFGSPGGPVYVSPRLGKGGRVFGCLKLRTMYVGSPLIVDEDSKTVVVAGDPRVTPVGRLLRRGFDELPQLLNVLAGDMTLIGPRPDPDWMLPRYGPASRRRLAIRPGISGLAQVLDSRGTLGSAEGYALDAWYVAHHSFALDAWIFAATLLYLAGFTGVGRRRLARLRAAGALDPSGHAPLPGDERA